MRLALELAAEAAEAGEVPVGCVIAGPDGSIIGRGRNRRNEKPDATSHAEMEAIREACENIGDWRLENCSLYVTLEPCPMCTGAIINSRIPTVVFGAREPVSGSCGSIIDLFSENYGHKPAVYAGVCAEDCSDILRSYFKDIREKNGRSE